ncbi:DoxX protein [Marinicauda algicola]|uniref:DoxX protein n=1 Tax=Marinicauda algicola TaxID=2029849 RepID=A0A4S2GZF6_9PROT|nr:DoxX protein [Marinicauda algicola]TGY88378.1 DoxX protein [Marinicauda algicola]
MTNLTLSLFILRVTLAAFFAVWALEKFLEPESTIAIFDHFYGIGGLPEWGSYAIGAVQAVLILAFLLWAKFRTVSVGLLLLMHAGSTLSTWQQLINPYEGPNHLFWAAVPTLGALIALFLLRREDRLWMIGASK